MFGVDVFNYGSVFNADGGEDTPTYFCIDCDDEYLDCEVWVGGERQKEDEKQIKDEWDEHSLGLVHINPNSARMIRKLSITSITNKYLELGYVKDCELAKKTSTSSSQDCSDTNQITNTDGTCGGCLDGYETDDNGNCVEVEEDDKTLIYGALGLGALALIMVMK